MSASPDSPLRDRLAGAAGELTPLDPPLAVAGAQLALRAEPADADALARTLAVLDEARAGVAVVGSGTKSWLGNPLRSDVRVALSTARLSGIDELDEADGVVRVGAGTPLRVVAEKAEAAGWLLPLDAPGAEGTIGGALATALVGPRRLGFGPTRDSVLGLDTVLADGTRTACGARVVKNVTGYDLAKLYVGSLGTLGVLERAWLRLRPLPASTRVVQVAAGEAGPSLALAAARAGTARAVALVDESLAAEAPGLGASPEPGARFRIVAELAGEAPATEQDAARIAERGASREDEGGAAIDALGALQTRVAPIGVRARIHVLPTALERCCAALAQAGGRVLAYPAPGVVYVWLDAALEEGEDPWWLDRALGVVEEARAAARGEAIIESLPAWGHGRRDVFGAPEGLGLMRSLKLRFDPNAVLNPGRFAGSI